MRATAIFKSAMVALDSGTGVAGVNPAAARSAHGMASVRNPGCQPGVSTRDAHSRAGIGA